MCGRYYLSNPEKLYSRYGIDKSENIEIEPNYNITPGSELPIIVSDTKGKHLRLVRWGLVPSWAKDPKVGFKAINARLETLSEKPSFKKPFRTQRALVPASGFFEWQKDGSKKTPFLIHSEKRDIISFAGLYDVWKDPNGKIVPTFTIITTSADDNVSPIHDRMPVTLKEDMEDKWLDLSIKDPDLLESILITAEDHGLETYQISSDVNKPKNNNKRLLVKV